MECLDLRRGRSYNIVGSSPASMAFPRVDGVPSRRWRAFASMACLRAVNAIRVRLHAIDATSDRWLDVVLRKMSPDAATHLHVLFIRRVGVM